MGDVTGVIAAGLVSAAVGGSPVGVCAGATSRTSSWAESNPSQPVRRSTYTPGASSDTADATACGLAKTALPGPETCDQVAKGASPGTPSSSIWPATAAVKTPP